MYIKNKFLLIVLLLAQPFTLMGGHPGSPMPFLPDLPDFPALPGRGTIANIALSAVQIYKFYWDRKLNPLQEKNIKAELQLKKQQLESNFVREEIAKTELQLRQQQLVNEQIQGSRGKIQWVKELKDTEEKTGEEPNLDTDKIINQLITKQYEDLDRCNQASQITQLNPQQLSECEQKIAKWVLKKLQEKNQAQTDSGQDNTEKIPSFAGATN